MDAGAMSFPLLPEDRRTTADEDVNAAIQGALALPDGVRPAPATPTQPFGLTWQFDFETGRFIRRGKSPAETNGHGALEQWCLMTVHSARYAHAVFTDEFGMEEPEAPLGEFATDEILADYGRHLEEALLVHDRVTAVDNIVLRFEPREGVLYIDNFDVTTDEDDVISLSDIVVERGEPL